MRDLHVVALSGDGQHLVLATRPGVDVGEFRVAVDDRLTAAVRGELRAPGASSTPSVTPKEIQARLRAGESVEQIAVSAGVPVGRIERFAGPVLSERERMITGARDAVVSRARRGPSDLALGPAVDQHLAEFAGYRPEDTAWSARRVDAGRWVVEVSWVARGRQRAAGWTYDPVTREAVPVDAGSAALAHVDLSEAPAARPVRTSARRAAPTAVRGGTAVRGSTSTPASASASGPASGRSAAGPTTSTGPRASRSRPAAAPTARRADAEAATSKAAGAARASAKATGSATTGGTATATRRGGGTKPGTRAPATPTTAQSPAGKAPAPATTTPAARRAGAGARAGAAAPEARKGKAPAAKSGDAPAAQGAKAPAARSVAAPAARRAAAPAAQRAGASGVQRADAPATRRAAAPKGQQAGAPAGRSTAGAPAARASRRAAASPSATPPAAARRTAATDVTEVVPSGPPVLRVVRPGEDVLADHRDAATTDHEGARARDTDERVAGSGRVRRAAGARASVPDWAEVLLGTAPLPRGEAPERSS